MIKIYTSTISFHMRIVEVVSQIQYDAPWKLFDTYLAAYFRESSLEFFAKIF